jgi:arsenite methyltransferase
MRMSDEQLRMNVNAEGQVGAEGGFLDEHFEACRPQYEEMLRSVGLKPGWRVLEAASGAGGYVPLMSQLVGSTGAICAFDLASDNVAIVKRRIESREFACPVDVQVASLINMPYGDAEFDAVWCANALEYLTDEELDIALSEFMRVLKPGGTLAIKDADPGLWMFAPGDPTLLWRAWDAASKVAINFMGTLRARTMRRRMERAGFSQTWQRGTLCEMWAPLEPMQHAYIAKQLLQIGALAENGGILPDKDLEFWKVQRDPTSPDRLVDNPELFWCEGHVLSVGLRPD